MKLCTRAVLFILFFFMTACSSDAGLQVIKIGDGERSFPDMIDDIGSSRAVFIGESHDNRSHHQTQLDIIKALHEKSIPFAVGLEMFTAKDQKSLDAWVSGNLSEDDFMPVFSRNWGAGWGLYRDIFLYAREHRIPLTGLNVPKGITKKVGENGFQSLTKEERAKLPPGITCELDPRYMNFIKLVFHFKKSNEKSFNNFCEAQVLWDQAMAWHLSQYLEKNPALSAVVLTGTIHAWKFGIPRQLGRFISVPSRVVLQEVPGLHSRIAGEDADYLILH
ncbi:MAG: ChaN family lipoprotein [bacterium]